MQKLRIVTARSLTSRFAPPADFPRHDCSPYRGPRNVWDSSIVQGPFSVAPRPNPNVTIRKAPALARQRTFGGAGKVAEIIGHQHHDVFWVPRDESRVFSTSASLTLVHRCVAPGIQRAAAEAGLGLRP
jgi:hypothetical protein